MHIGADAPFVYLPDTVFKEIYDAPTLLTYGFNVDEALQPQMGKNFLSSYVRRKFFGCLYFHQVVGKSSLIPVQQYDSGYRRSDWMYHTAFAGLISFTSMIITNIITRRHGFATYAGIGYDRQSSFAA